MSLRLLAALFVGVVVLAGCSDESQRLATPGAAESDTDTNTNTNTDADTASSDQDDSTPDEADEPNDDEDSEGGDDAADTDPQDEPADPSTTAPRENELGTPLTLDQSGDLACANAEFAQDSILNGDLETAADDVAAAAERAAQSEVAEMATAGPAIAEALSATDPLEAVQDFLAVCTSHGYEL